MNVGYLFLLFGLLVIAFGGYLHWQVERSGSWSEVHLPFYPVGAVIVLISSLGLAFDGSNQPIPLIVFGGITLVGGAIYCDGLARNRW